MVVLADIPLASLGSERLPSTVHRINAPFVRVTAYARDARGMRTPCTVH